MLSVPACYYVLSLLLFTCPAMATNRLAIVTGGNKGIGYHIAGQLLAANHRVILACRSEERAREAAASLGGNCSAAKLDISSQESIKAFADTIMSQEEEVHVLVNNAGIAFKSADPTPFPLQTRPTLQTNFEGTVAVTEALLPILRKASHPRIVNVASMAGALRQLSPPLQAKFSSLELTLDSLLDLVKEFEQAVADGSHRDKGWSNSNYGLSKLAVIAYTKELARREPGMRVNACCPGYCDTDMTSHRGPRPAAVGARTPVLLALLGDDGPTGTFWQDEHESVW